MLGGDEVGFVDDEGVCEFDLIDEEVGNGALILFAEGEVFFLQRIAGFVVVEEVRGVDNGDHGVEVREVLEAFAVLVGEGEGLRNGEGLGDAGGFDEEMVETVFRGEAGDFLEEVVAEGATDAAVGHFDEFLLGAAQLRPALANKLGVNIYLAHIIHDHRYTQSLPVVKHMVEQRCLSRSQKA